MKTLKLQGNAIVDNKKITIINIVNDDILIINNKNNIIVKDTYGKIKLYLDDPSEYHINDNCILEYDCILMEVNNINNVNANKLNSIYCFKKKKYTKLIIECNMMSHDINKLKLLNTLKGE